MTDPAPQSDRHAATSVPLHPLLAQRWSPRALDPTAEVGEDQLRALFEAARWAPSWGNTQPARFLVGRRGDATFQCIHDTLVPGNQAWAAASGALVLGVAATHDHAGDPLPYAEYGLALATQNLVVQAMAEGLFTHQMAGFDQEAARKVFELPEGFQPLVVVAVGTLAEPGAAPAELVERDARPRSRKPLSELVFGPGWGVPAF
ncbi:nitroreductase family protein [Longimycelium tulufanense]|uniref:nitroreductase family protein n=1 Tax=Longimycelium tulufanense TaxID=907463 RepID=UPI001E36EB39|nr:nitroreductase family protein [Longimycelium tulufanense]